MLLVLAVLTIALFGCIWPAAGAAAPDAGAAERYLPRLGLDLEGGTSVTLIPRATEGGDIPQDNLRQAVAIIRQRVDGAGVAESEVTTAGSNIVVAIPGERDDRLVERVQQTAELRFRPVLAVAAPTPVDPNATLAPQDPNVTAPPVDPGATPAPDAPSVPPVPSPSTQPRAVPSALLAAPAVTPVPDPAAPPAVPDPAAPAVPDPAANPAVPPAAPDPAADPALAGVTPELAQAFAGLDCTDPANRAGSGADKAEEPIVACDRDGTAKYLLGPTGLAGDEVSSATATLAQNQQGVTTGGWVVRLDFTSEGSETFGEITTRLSQQQPPRNQFGIVLDGVVVSAPSVSNAIFGGAEISGNFTQAEASDLANVLKFGALPLSFDPGDVSEISETLGGEQLQAGLIAGAIGLGLVALYSLAYYRGLGLVTVASLAIAAVLTYGLIVLLGWLIGFRLTLAGIAGIIVAVGVTADSFVIYFERLRDEVREGRTVRVAVEEGWRRARRTIIVSDVVSLIAAATLYLLSSANVKGFAFALGLTTLVDLAVVFLFTKPLVTMLAHTKFFGGGHRFSGLDPARLGARARPERAPLTRRRRPASTSALSTSQATATTREA